MFAFCFYSVAGRTLTPMEINLDKKHYPFIGNDLIIFASEIKSITNYLGNTEVNHNGILNPLYTTRLFQWNDMFQKY